MFVCALYNNLDTVVTNYTIGLQKQKIYLAAVWDDVRRTKPNNHKNNFKWNEIHTSVGCERSIYSYSLHSTAVPFECSNNRVKWYYILRYYMAVGIYNK